MEKAITASRSRRSVSQNQLECCRHLCKYFKRLKFGSRVGKAAVVSGAWLSKKIPSFLTLSEPERNRKTSAFEVPAKQNKWKQTDDASLFSVTMKFWQQSRNEAKTIKKKFFLHRWPNMTEHKSTCAALLSPCIFTFKQFDCCAIHEFIELLFLHENVDIFHHCNTFRCNGCENAFFPCSSTDAMLRLPNSRIWN